MRRLRGLDNFFRTLAFLAAFLAFAGRTAFAQAAVPSPESSPAGSPDVPQASSLPDQSSLAALAPGHGLHSVTVTFDYNFTLTPACTQKVREHCIQRFVAYDISAGYARRARLFTIPVPDDAKGQMHGITATGPKLDFESGKHLLAVTAQEPSGIESKHYAATVWVVVP